MELSKYNNQILLSLTCCLFILMAFNATAQKQFVTEVAYKSNLVKQKKLSSQTLAQLHKDNVTESQEMRLEYVFHTNASQKAKDLAGQLQVFGYEAEFKKHPDNSKIYIVTGLTMKIKMSEKPVLEWTKVMCDLGYEFDSEFKSWKASSK